MRVFCVVAYKGTRFYGWEKQIGQISIQEEIESALGKVFNSSITIHGSGRTDAGVHALGQTFHFDVDENRYSQDDLKYRLNSILPADIQIKSIKYLGNDSNFHSRFSATRKVYEYHLCLNAKDPFKYDSCWMLKASTFDEELFDASIKKFVGVHNFENFTSKEEDSDNFIREIFSINWRFDRENGEIVIEIDGNGFMRYQIRYIIGTAVNIAIGKEKIDFIDKKLDSDETRSIVSYKAPAQGLYLKEVRYE